MEKTSDGSWEKVLKRLDLMETKLMNRKQYLDEIRAIEAMKQTVVSSEKPFRCLRDAISRLLFKGVFASSGSPDVFLRISNCKEDSENGETNTAELIRMENSLSLEAIYQSESHPLESIPPRKRRKLSTLSGLSIEIRQKMNSDLKYAWSAASMACIYRATKDLEVELNQLQKALANTTARTSSILTLLSPETREVLRSVIHFPQTGQSIPTDHTAEAKSVCSSTSLTSTRLPLGFPSTYFDERSSYGQHQTQHHSQSLACRREDQTALINLQQQQQQRPNYLQRSGYVVAPTSARISDPSTLPLLQHHMVNQSSAQHHSKIPLPTLSKTPLPVPHYRSTENIVDPSMIQQHGIAKQHMRQMPQQAYSHFQQSSIQQTPSIHQEFNRPPQAMHSQIRSQSVCATQQQFQPHATLYKHLQQPFRRPSQQDETNVVQTIDMNHGRRVSFGPSTVAIQPMINDASSQGGNESVGRSHIGLEQQNLLNRSKTLKNGRKKNHLPTRRAYSTGRSLISCTFEWDQDWATQTTDNSFDISNESSKESFSHRDLNAVTDTVLTSFEATSDNSNKCVGSYLKINRRWFAQRLQNHSLEFSDGNSLSRNYRYGDQRQTISSASELDNQSINPHFPDKSMQECFFSSFMVAPHSSATDFVLPFPYPAHFYKSNTLTLVPPSSSLHFKDSSNKSFDSPSEEMFRKSTLMGSSPSVKQHRKPDRSNLLTRSFHWECSLQESSSYDQSDSLEPVLCVSGIQSESEPENMNNNDSRHLHSSLFGSPSRQPSPPTLSLTSITGSSSEFINQPNSNDHGTDTNFCQNHLLLKEYAQVHAMTYGHPNINLLPRKIEKDIIEDNTDNKYPSTHLTRDNKQELLENLYKDPSNSEASSSQSRINVNQSFSTLQEDHKTSNYQRHDETLMGSSSKPQKQQRSPPLTTRCELAITPLDNSSGSLKERNNGSRHKLSSGSMYSEADNLDLLKPEAILGRLVQLKGPSVNIFLETKETEQLHLEHMERFFMMFRRQNLNDTAAIRMICNGKGAGIVIIVLGLVLVLLGVLPLLLGLGYREKKVFYTSNETYVFLPLDVANWKSDREAFIFFYIENFHGTFRSTYVSRPNEFFSGYSCKDKTNLKAVEEVRPINTIPEIQNTNYNGFYFPCGLSSYSIFNDNIEMYSKDEDSEGLIQWSTQETSAHFPLINFARQSRPENLTPSNDWIDVLSPQYRNWMETPAGKNRYLLVARLPRGLKKGNYSFKLIQNSKKPEWPSESWAAQKAIAVAQLSYIGSSQFTIGILFIAWGILMILAGVIFLVLVKRKFVCVTQSASEVPHKEIEKIITALCSQNEAVRKELFSRLQRRRLSVAVT